MSIYFIGGASASGKSTAAKKLASLSFPVVELDDFHRILMNCIIDCEKLELATENVAETAVRQLLASHSSCLVEGGWIKPEKASILRAEFGDVFQSVFCGYPRGVASERLKEIKQAGTHWLAAYPDDFCLNFLQKQIDGSKWYEEECDKFSLTFIDFSNFSAGQSTLLASCPAFVRTDVK